MLGPMEPHDSLVMMAAPIAIPGSERGLGEAPLPHRPPRAGRLLSRSVVACAVLATVGLMLLAFTAGGPVAGPYPF